MMGWRISHVLLLLYVVATTWNKCGAVEVTVVANFNMKGVIGSITFFQSLSWGNITRITVSLSGLDQYPSETFPWHVHNYPFTTQERNPCSAASVGGHFDPFMASSRPNYSTSCSIKDPSLCEVGDLSGKFGLLPTTLGFLVDSYLPLYGVHSIVGRSVVIHRNDNTRWVCANIEYPSDVTVAYSPFRTVFGGNIFFIEPYSPMGLTTVFVRLSNISGSGNSNSHNWHVHRDLIGSGGNCDDGGPHYNPRDIDVNSPDYSYCSPSNQTACEVGDLTGKGARLNFINGHSDSFYTDTQLPVRLNRLNETILHRSVVVHASGAGAARIGCANLIEYIPRTAIARFQGDGVSGQIVFKQSSPFSPTTVRIELSGLSSRADGYHVHEFPVDETISESSKCTAAGGHFNPRNIVRNSSSPTTFDAYEIGDLSGKFGGLLDQNSFNSNYSDPYLPMFGTESIVGRSVVIHHPDDSRWLCANIGYHMETLETFSVTTSYTSDTLQGKLVLTQIANDPYSETTIFLDFNIGPPVISSSSSSSGVMMTPTPTQLSTSVDVVPSSGSVTTSLSTSLSITVSSSLLTTRLSSSSTMIPVTFTPSTITPSLSVLSSSSDSTSMVMVTSMMSSSTQVMVTPTSQSSSSMPTIVSSTSSVITMATSSIIDDKTPSDDKPSATSTMTTSIGMTMSSSSISASSTTSVFTESNSMTLDVGSGFMASSSMPSSSPTDQPPDSRKKKDVFKRQTQPLYLSIQESCDSEASVANPYSAPSSCSPTNQLACPVGDLMGKHGPLSSGRNLLTDLNLPLTGPNSIAGMVVAVRLGDFNSPIVGCMPLPLSAFPSPTPTPSVSNTPGTQEEGTDDGNMTVIIIACGVGGAFLVFLVLLLVICCCVWRHRRRTWKADFVKSNHSATNHKTSSADIELGKVTYKQTQPTAKAEQYIALYDYEPQSENDLELKENDIITLLEKGENGEWYCGQVGEKKGWFPAKYVRPINGSEGSEAKKTMKEGDMTKAAAAILVANFNITRSNTGSISESDVSKLKRTRSEITGAAKPTPPKVSPKNRERKLTHTGIVQQKDIDSTPRGTKKLVAKEGAMVFTNQIVNNAPVEAAAVSSEPSGTEVIEHPISPMSGDEIWIADYDLECNSEDELSLKRGEMIYVVEKSESGWWKGRCDDGRAGWFPASYLRAPTSQEVQEKKKKQIVGILEKKTNKETPVKSSSPTTTPKLAEREAPVGDVALQKDTSPSTEGGIDYVAKFAFEGNNVNDLSFWPGDIIKVLWAEDSGWWHGQLGSKQGWFPGSYVEPREGGTIPTEEVEMEILLEEESVDEDDFSTEEDDDDVEEAERNEPITEVAKMPVENKRESTGSLGFSKELSSILASKMSTLNGNEAENVPKGDETAKENETNSKETGKSQRRKPPPPPTKPKPNTDATDAMATPVTNMVVNPKEVAKIAKSLSNKVVDVQSENTADKSTAQDASSSAVTQSNDKPKPSTSRRRPPPVPKPKDSAKTDETDSNLNKSETPAEGASQPTDSKISKPAEVSAERDSQTVVQPSKRPRKQRPQKQRPVLPKRTVKSVLVVPMGGLQRERPPTPSPNKPIPPPPSKPCPPRPTVVKTIDSPVVEKKEVVEATAKPASPMIKSKKSSDEVDAVTTKPKPPLKPKPKLLPKPKLPKPEVLPKPKLDSKASQVESTDNKPTVSPRLQPSETAKKNVQEPVPAPRKKKPNAPKRSTSLHSPENAKMTEARDSPDGAEDVKVDKKTVGTSSHPSRPPPRPPVSKKLMEKQESLKKINLPTPVVEPTKTDDVTSEPKVLFDLSQQPQENKNPRQEQGRSSFFKSLKKMVQKSGSSDSPTNDTHHKTEVTSTDDRKPPVEDAPSTKDVSHKAEASPLVSKKQPEKTADVKETRVARMRSMPIPTQPTPSTDSTDSGGNARPPKPNKPVPQLPALKTISETLENSLSEKDDKTDNRVTDRPQVPKRRKQSQSPEVELPPSEKDDKTDNCVADRPQVPKRRKKSQSPEVEPPPSGDSLKSPTKPKPERPPPPKFSSPQDPVKPEVILRAHTISSRDDVAAKTRVKLRRAKCSYIAKKTGELSFNKGDVLTEMEPKNKNGMCYGMLDNGTSGFYQDKFVELFTTT